MTKYVIPMKFDDNFIKGIIICDYHDNKNNNRIIIYNNNIMAQKNYESYIVLTPNIMCNEQNDIVLE